MWLSKTRQTASAPHRRRLSFEPLEERNLLAIYTVSESGDAPVSAAGDAPGTLRQAIFDANQADDPDIIEFAPNLASISLAVVGDSSAGDSALMIASPIKIQGHSQGITIGRGVGSPMRLFYVGAGGELSFQSITLTGGVAEGALGQDGLGGAVFVSATGQLEIDSSTLTNHIARGGSGGVARGGAIYSHGGPVDIVNSTFSANATRNASDAVAGFGAGIYARDAVVSIYSSTITNSEATAGRGVYVVIETVGAVARLNLFNSIVAQSSAPTTDVVATNGDQAPTESVIYMGAFNIIRQGNLTTINNSGINADPLLGPLLNNGGPTLTHAPLDDSPALDSGHPDAVAGDDVPLYDQRGTGHHRIRHGDAIPGARIDIGAMERQSAGQELPGDYNGDHRVNAADYTVWRNTFGDDVDEFEGADGDGSGEIDAGDFIVWKENYGEELMEAASISPPVLGALSATPPLKVDRLAAVIEVSFTVAGLPDQADTIRAPRAAEFAASVACERPAVRKQSGENSRGSRDANGMLPGQNRAELFLFLPASNGSDAMSFQSSSDEKLVEVEEPTSDADLEQAWAEWPAARLLHRFD
jgi:hypothetical protein